MKLHEYFESFPKKQRAKLILKFAQTCNRSTASVYGWIRFSKCQNNPKCPSPVSAALIQKATKGKVKIVEALGLTTKN